MSGERYPSPSGASGEQNVGSLPFYSQQPVQNPQAEHEQQRHQHEGQNAPDAGPGANADERPQQQGAMQDDSQLREELSSMIGSFGQYPPVMQQQQHQGPQQPQYQNGGGLPLPPSPFVQQAGGEQSTRNTPRTKTSRACDECRRKKIRCDASDETANQPCSSCVRTGARCAFSRQPMKRGPSKGYIKELAERLNTLEKQVGPGGNPEVNDGLREEVRRVQREMQQVQNMHDGMGILDPRVGDKRSHATSEMAHGQPQTPMQHQQHQQPGQYPPQPPQQQLYYAPPYQPQTAKMGQQSGQQPFWRHGAPATTQEDTALNHRAAEEVGPAINNFDWDESIINEYYRIIHQTFPLLPNSKHRLRQRLGECPGSLRDAFLAALDCLMRTFPTTSLAPNANYAQAIKKAAELLAKYPFDNPSSHTNATNLVYLQTLLLMALECDNHGPATIRGEAGPSRAEWLGRAAGVAGQLEINVIRTGASQSLLDGDRDSEERLARRVWWVLFILDRWHASSTADLLKLPENSVVLLPEDQMLLGESTYHLARLSFIVGHLAAILTTTKRPSTDVMAPTNPASALLGLTLAGEIDRFRESVESVWGSLNLVHLSYHHCHLLIKRLNPTTEPVEMVEHAVKVATVLNSRMTPVTPLNHHFGALAAMTLCELCDVPKTRAEALRGLDQLSEALGEGRGLAGKTESEGWDGAVRELVNRKRERMAQGAGGLETLAEAAGSEGQGFDPTGLTRHGYLSALGQGRFKA
ncbi:Glucose-responsive transcription factor [Saxophila tyrrhenica]|uniref:Glucose-responsive transcription factor n=1 Tax=Saxophila tyrrhenica TaxID=1690608 RepID=A0AAV9NVR5_9PEZI|nr:Glucose-responsive transcription factor [Saxophila tyrrhenica]